MGRFSEAKRLLELHDHEAARTALEDFERGAVSAADRSAREKQTSPLREQLERIVGLCWDRIERSKAEGRTVTLKLKLKDFTGLTRARSLTQPVQDRNHFAEIGHALLAELLPLPQPVRLMGLTLSQLVEDEPESQAPIRSVSQLSLF